LTQAHTKQHSSPGVQISTEAQLVTTVRNGSNTSTTIYTVLTVGTPLSTFELMLLCVKNTLRVIDLLN